MFPIALPPLRERPEDILALASHFLALHGDREGTGSCRLSLASQRLLQTHRWPGNVRELENEMQRALAMAEPGAVITPKPLSPSVQPRDIPVGISPLRHYRTWNLAPLEFLSADADFLRSTEALLRSGASVRWDGRGISALEDRRDRIAELFYDPPPLGGFHGVALGPDAVSARVLLCWQVCGPASRAVRCGEASEASGRPSVTRLVPLGARFLELDPSVLPPREGGDVATRYIFR